MYGDHVNVRTSDAQRALSFYRTVGLEVCGCLQLGDRYNLYLGPPGERHSLELTVIPNGDLGSIGDTHFAIAVGDLDAKVAELRAAGFDPESDPVNPAGRTEWRICFVRDPDGNRVELIEGDQMTTPRDPLPAGVT